MAYAPKKPFTIQDVARQANVSTKTVSRVINKEPGVNAATRARVAQVIKEMDYRPNINAQSLAGDRSFLIGLFIENPGSYVTDLQTGVIERCREAGFHLMVEPWDAKEPDLGEMVTTLLRQLRLDAVILLPAHCDNPVILDALEREHIPFVRIAPKQNRPDSPVIRTHDYVAARLLTAHLLGYGHRRVGFILGCPGHSATEQRYQAFCDEMALQGVTVDPELVAPGDFLFEQAEIAAERLLTMDNPPTAIFACNDDMAVAVLAVAARLGIKVPQDLSVTGFDDTPVSRMTWPQITTVRQPVQEIGRAAADLIITYAPRRNGWPDLMPNRLLEFELVIRQSTGPVPANRIER
jgi:LacI family transcriptional regulator